MAQVKLVYDEKELKWFFDNIYPELKNDEVIFLSLSGRNKYLTDEEKISLELGRSEMFSKTIIREKKWERIIKTIRRFECDERGYVTKNNTPIPSKAMVCYININPSSTLKSLNEFNKIINEYMFELMNVGVKKLSNENIINRLNKIDNNLMTAYQQSVGTRHWIDFDFDVNKDWKVYESETLKKFFAEKGILTYFWIDTKSGYHLLIKKDELKFNPNELTQAAEKEYTSWFFSKYKEDTDLEKLNAFEIIQNKNSMIPLPGTLQGDYPVRVLNKNNVIIK